MRYSRLLAIFVFFSVLLPSTSLIAFMFSAYGGVTFLTPLVLACHIIFLLMAAVFFILGRRLIRHARGAFKILDIAGVPTWEWTSAKNALGVLRINQHFKDLLGLTEEQDTFNEDWYAKRIHPAERDEVLYMPVSNKLLPGQEYSAQCRFLHEDGHWHWVEIRGYATNWAADGTPVRLMGICLDIQKQMDHEMEILEYQYVLEEKILDRTLALHDTETSMNREKARLRAVMHNLPDIVYYKDCEHRLMGASKSFLDFFHISEEAMQNEETRSEVFSKGFTSEVLETLQQQDQYVMDHGELHIEECLEQPDGTLRWFETLKLRYTDEKGEVLGTMGISRDITQQKNTSPPNTQNDNTQQENS